LILIVVAAAAWASLTYSEHHVGENSRAFEVLYRHVVPAPLVKPHPVASSDELGNEHGEEHGDEEHGSASAHGGAIDPLFAVTLPFLPAAMDGDRNASNGTQLVLTNLQIFQLAALLLVLIAFSGVPGHLRTGKGDPISRVLAGMCLAIRDEMVRPVLGKEDGDRFLPYFLSVFFFILFMNLMGLVPGGATATASIYVTAALALTTFMAMIGCGMVAQGPLAFFKNLVPHVPGWLWPLMFVVEILGLLVKPFALMIRLFANMTGGHLVVLSFMGLIFFFAGTEHGVAGWGISPVAVGFAAFIMIIEGFVALLQAYIFTQLSIIFVGASVHPEH
jgi:F-type H+-transporting ATPase subunit a